VKEGYLYLLYIEVLTTGETLECRVTIDGTAYLLNAGLVAGANTIYYVTIRISHTNQISAGTTTLQAFRNTGYWFKSLKVEVRKTTNAGAGNLIGACHYGLYKP